MAVPKRKKSRSRTRTRRAEWAGALTAPALVDVTTPDGRALRVPRRLVAAARRGLL
ncbi:50S ribosomal protein L32 [Saccharopolyspora sp. HNM0983]|uniref:Large ribosomal subunit protein bL32 n=1 Tax=Saccharopolyspora montiporae TaxID=2781240 RepID=A0A929FZE1_9PSEU|nr:50S ribosomal protein L32 [Saccharopolyspora sp. HNM0983]MBE9373642.1 50S ribosomal protein L32 [Saccharopolyspora sp. HNM0983]